MTADALYNKDHIL